MSWGRGIAVFAAGLGVWLAARLTGSATLHVVAVVLVVLPPVAMAYGRLGRRRLAAERRLSKTRVAPGQSVEIQIDVENRSSRSTSFLLVEDHLPPTLGRPARLVIDGIPARGRRRASYTLRPRARGQFPIGPLTIDVSDPLALTAIRSDFSEHDQLVVTPEVEDLSGETGSPFGTGMGQSLSRRLLRTGEEFYTMREYQIGDDLRRIHWASVARSGRLMIRQDESSHRSKAVIFLDTRVSALGETHTPAFEKAVSAAASVGVVLSRAGFALQLVTPQAAPAPLTQDQFLEALAPLDHHSSRMLAPAMSRLRSAAATDTTLVAVTAPPPPLELAGLIRAGTAFGPKIAVLVYPTDPDGLPPDRRAHLEERASVARLSLTRAGWEAVVLAPSRRLREVWNTYNSRPLAAGTSSR